MPLQVEKCNINDTEIFLALGCTWEEIEGYKKVKSVQQNIGYELEEYLAWESRYDPKVKYVARKRNRPKSTDFIIDEEKWSIKNAIYTENWTARKGRIESDGVKNHWYRRDDKGNYYWHECPIKGCSEERFRAFCLGLGDSIDEASPLIQNCVVTVE